MTRSRRTQTDRELLDMQLSKSAARRLRGDWPLESVTPTGLFLWLAFAATLLTLAGTYVWEWHRAKQDCNDLASPEARVECTQRGEGKAGGEGQKARHDGQSAGAAWGRA